MKCQFFSNLLKSTVEFPSSWVVFIGFTSLSTIFQSLCDLEACFRDCVRYPISEIQVARSGIEPRTPCSTSQELNHTLLPVFPLVKSPSQGSHQRSHRQPFVECPYGETLFLKQSLDSKTTTLVTNSKPTAQHASPDSITTSLSVVTQGRQQTNWSLLTLLSEIDRVQFAITVIASYMVQFFYYFQWYCRVTTCKQENQSLKQELRQRVCQGMPLWSLPWPK